MNLRCVWKNLVLIAKCDDTFLLVARAAILLGLTLLALEFARPLVTSVVYNNVGSVQLDRALLGPGLEPDERAGHAVGAGRMFGTALAWDPLNGQAYYNLAAVYDVWWETPAAFSALNRSAILNPGDVCARFRFGQALAAQGRGREAVEEWRAADAVEFLLNDGQALASEGDRAGALVQYERAVAVAPDMPEAYYRLGQALAAQGREEEALTALEWAVAREPLSSPKRYLVQAEINVAREEWAAALAALQQAADLSPDDPTPFYRMGLLLTNKLDDDDAAIARFQAALEIDPYHAASRLMLGQLYGEQGECEAAAGWLAPLLSPDGAARAGSDQAGKAHALLATCLQGEGRGDVAISHLEQAAALNPKSARYLLLLALGYQEVGRTDDAIEAYRRVLALAPDNAQARQALEELGWREP
jgi:protein O-GlcNAc transferase